MLGSQENAEAELAQAETALANTQRMIDDTRAQLVSAQTALAAIVEEYKKEKDKTLKEMYKMQATACSKEIEGYSKQIERYQEDANHSSGQLRQLKDLKLRIISKNFETLSISGTEVIHLFLDCVFLRNARK